MRGIIDRYWEEWTLALADPDPGRASLRSLITGDAEVAVVAQLEKSKALNEVSKRTPPGPLPHRTLSIVMAAERATVTECVVDDTITIERATQSTLSTIVEGLLLQRTVVRRDGKWKISDNARLRTLEAGEACDSL